MVSQSLPFERSAHRSGTITKSEHRRESALSLVFGLILGAAGAARRTLSIERGIGPQFDEESEELISSGVGVRLQVGG